MSRLRLFLRANVVFALLAAASLWAIAAAQPESTYIERWCAAHGGESEVVLQDGSRADCITGDHAVEVERAYNYKEGIGQALRYAMLTGKRALMVVIVGPDDQEYIQNLRALVSRYQLPIDVMTVPR